MRENGGGRWASICDFSGLMLFGKPHKRYTEIWEKSWSEFQKYEKSKAMVGDSAGAQAKLAEVAKPLVAANGGERGKSC